MKRHTGNTARNCYSFAVVPFPFADLSSRMHGKCCAKAAAWRAAVVALADVYRETVKTDVLLRRIETTDLRPWRCNPRPLGVHKTKRLETVLGEMIQTGAERNPIETSNRQKAGGFKRSYKVREMGPVSLCICP